MDGNICMAAFRDYIGPETEIKPNILRSTLDIVSTDVDCLSRIYKLRFVRISTESIKSNELDSFLYVSNRYIGLLSPLARIKCYHR